MKVDVKIDKADLDKATRDEIKNLKKGIQSLTNKLKDRESKIEQLIYERDELQKHLDKTRRLIDAVKELGNWKYEGPYDPSL